MRTFNPGKNSSELLRKARWIPDPDENLVNLMGGRTGCESAKLNPRKLFGTDLTAGGIGCALSHMPLGEQLGKGNVVVHS